MKEYFDRIESIIQERDDVKIEELRDFVAEITSETMFEIPRYRLEPIFNIITEKLDAAIEHENIYILEILLDCLKFMNARHIPAEKKYYDLANEAQMIAYHLLKIINMEGKDHEEM